MKPPNPLIAFAVLTAVVGLYQNWGTTFTQAWWFAAIGGMSLGALHFATRYATTAMGALGALLLVPMLFDASFMKALDRSMFSGLACGLLAGLCIGYAVKTILRGRNRD